MEQEGRRWHSIKALWITNFGDGHWLTIKSRESGGSMATEKRLIDVNKIPESATAISTEGRLYVAWSELVTMPTVDAVEVEEYRALLEMYHDLRENFIDYYCSGTPNVAPYCQNRCEECVTPHGWCKALSDKCRGFNPAEVIIDGERKDNGTA